MNCPLCLSSQTALFLEGDQREYQACSVCALIFVPSSHHLPLDEERARYLEHENSLDNPGYVNMFQKKIDLLQLHCPNITRILDYGCGYEPVLKALLKRAGFQAEGFDPYFFQEWDKNARYDLVISTETVEHFSQPGKELQTMLSALAPRGYLALMTRFYPSRDREHDRDAFSDWYYKRDPTHVAFYGPATFDWIADALALKIIHTNDFDFIIMQKTL
ncbi:MAG: class I SAM-dependent methyltransferase [Candidatus Nitrohelix vancouverensis]|uniref:Class I SAM-dependent methyltransferase n=1 Tax=Candidatus Nitrohelix vancouverensis TaxID=2705534 RepID=A0A7T0BZV6_9BACT|nr:MAG: class I SAM-dependent methyltransferase [Candidatus Nitrohelix vancouverensis]